MAEIEWKCALSIVRALHYSDGYNNVNYSFWLPSIAARTSTFAHWIYVNISVRFVRCLLWSSSISGAFRLLISILYSGDAEVNENYGQSNKLLILRQLIQLQFRVSVCMRLVIEKQTDSVCCSNVCCLCGDYAIANHNIHLMETKHCVWYLVVGPQATNIIKRNIYHDLVRFVFVDFRSIPIS